MARSVKVIFMDERVEEIEVANDVKLAAILLESEGEDFFVIPTLRGGEYLLRKSATYAVVKNGTG